MRYHESERQSVASILFAALLSTVLTLPWSQPAFGEQKSITLPKETEVEKVGPGHFRFKLPDGQVVEATGLVSRDGIVSIKGDLKVYDRTRKIIASGKQGNLIANGRITRESARRRPQKDYIMIDNALTLLPATIIFQTVEIKDYVTPSTIRKDSQPGKALRETVIVTPAGTATAVQNPEVCPSVCENDFSVIRELRSGSCGPWMKLYCGPYLCDESSGLCKTSCSYAYDCASGAECNNMSRRCVYWTFSCKDAYTLVSAWGDETSCYPYKCKAGYCKEHCYDPGGCADGWECKNGRCFEK